MYYRIKNGVIVVFITIGGLLTVPFTLGNLQIRSHLKLLGRTYKNAVMRPKTLYDSSPSLHSIMFLIYKLAIVSVSIVKQQYRAYTYSMLVGAKLAEQRLMFEMLAPFIEVLDVKKKPMRKRRKIIKKI